MKKLNNSGYTLVEIILAIAILGIALVPILSFMINSSGIITYADEREMAILLSQQKMEDVKSTDYDSISDENNIDIDNTTYTNLDLTRYPDYTAEIIIDEYTEGEINIKNIEIIITWNTNKLVTLKSKVVDR